ncbi:Cytochrome c oxidase subunit 6A1, mitochondrial [Podochytrium sp. JEL0797]|nr:Cytochrome c oxidase subunit 6A1, mitochondrial [Podochytrium sp. JEL0797]
MSFARNAIRLFSSTAARRSAVTVPEQFTPNVPASFPSVKETMLKPNFSEFQHAHKSTTSWFWINLFVTIPGLAAMFYIGVPPELEHLHHLAEHPREFEPLPYMRKRRNQYPWGDNSLFHNDNSNPGPN